MAVHGRMLSSHCSSPPHSQPSCISNACTVGRHASCSGGSAAAECHRRRRQRAGCVCDGRAARSALSHPPALSVVYSPSSAWNTRLGSQGTYSGGSLRYTSTAGASVSLNFNGSKLRSVSFPVSLPSQRVVYCLRRRHHYRSRQFQCLARRRRCKNYIRQLRHVPLGSLPLPTARQSRHRTHHNDSPCRRC